MIVKSSNKKITENINIKITNKDGRIYCLTVIRVIFFAIRYGQNTESAFPFMRLLDILDVKSLYKLQILKFAYLWQRSELLDVFHDY
jgi:hypothetical protein